ncbi:hypothetical protein GcC1_151007 [Golovinomyces cichoracearum]|uniref:Uncharacterized protein n=1 Tax=Golovinomyces cichoracearum TaxID=62708 RepID=A0A420HX43_9PEZI|nr:hypothetical protein GcC1_151007 [Golovinomyces cichoracearum]
MQNPLECRGQRRALDAVAMEKALCMLFFIHTWGERPPSTSRIHIGVKADFYISHVGDDATVDMTPNEKPSSSARPWVYVNGSSSTSSHISERTHLDRLPCQKRSCDYLHLLHVILFERWACTSHK